MSSFHSRFSDAIEKISCDSGRSMMLILATALTLRVAVAFWLPAEIVWPDGHRYEQVADNLLHGRGFGSLSDNQLSVPTQPLLIAAVKLIFGPSYLALRLFFCVLGAATCVLGYVLAGKLFTPGIGLISGSLLAVYPLYVYLSALFEYPQTFYIFIIALAFILLYDFLDSSRPVRLFACGVAFGLAILTVPTTLIFLPFLLIVLRSPKISDWLIRAVVVLAAISIPVGAWTARNYLAYGEPILVNKASGTNFWVANNGTYYLYGKIGVVPPCATGYEDTEYCKANLALSRSLAARNLTESQYIAAHEKASWQNGMKFIRDNPVPFAYLTLKKFLKFWSPDPDAVTPGQVGSFRLWLARFSYLPVLGFGVAGLTLSFIRCRSRSLPILYFILALSLPYCVFLPTTRYRLPLDLFLVIFASAVISNGFGARPFPWWISVSGSAQKGEKNPTRSLSAYNQAWSQ
jgi:4-amino-4-deoxy-L-arabinose transferase-like glycosyltransferase